MRPVSGSIRWIFRSRYSATQSAPSAQVSPELPSAAGDGIVASTAPLDGSIFRMMPFPS